MATAEEDNDFLIRPLYTENADVVEQEDELPREFFCPITNKVMRDPVHFKDDGNIYERSAITQWLKTSAQSPVSGAAIRSHVLIPAVHLRKRIRREIRYNMEKTKRHRVVRLWENELALKMWRNGLRSFELDFDGDDDTLSFLRERLRWVEGHPKFLTPREALKWEGEEDTVFSFEELSAELDDLDHPSKFTESLGALMTPSRGRDSSYTLARMVRDEQLSHVRKMNSDETMLKDAFVASSTKTNQTFHGPGRPSIDDNDVSRSSATSSTDSGTPLSGRPPSSMEYSTDSGTPLSALSQGPMNGSYHVLDGIKEKDADEVTDEGDEDNDEVMRSIDENTQIGSLPAIVGCKIRITFGKRSGLTGVVVGPGRRRGRFQILLDKHARGSQDIKHVELAPSKFDVISNENTIARDVARRASLRSEGSFFKPKNMSENVKSDVDMLDTESLAIAIDPSGYRKDTDILKNEVAHGIPGFMKDTIDALFDPKESPLQKKKSRELNGYHRSLSQKNVKRYASPTSSSSRQDLGTPRTPAPFSSETPGTPALFSDGSQFETKKPKKVTPPKKEEMFVAQWAYSARDEEELELKKSDVVTILDKDTDWGEDWWKGTVHGRVGYFPRTYVRSVKL